MTEEAELSSDHLKMAQAHVGPNEDSSIVTRETGDPGVEAVGLREQTGLWEEEHLRLEPNFQGEAWHGAGHWLGCAHTEGNAQGDPGIGLSQ